MITTYEKEKELSDSLNEIKNFIASKFNTNKKFYWTQYASSLNLEQEFHLRILGTEFVIGFGTTPNQFIFVNVGEPNNYKNSQKYNATNPDKAILNVFRYFEEMMGF